MHLVVGLEIHLKIKSPNKLFCQCVNSQDFEAVAPNTHVCPVCTAQPGALPVLNKEPLLQVIKLGQALKCTINTVSRFDRKSYFYPDLPAGYQITQFYYPLCTKGKVSFFLDQNFSVSKTVGIRDAHIETDTAKTIYLNDQALLDFNRAGTPLVEIVTEPDFFSVDEVVGFLKELQKIAKYNDISDADMEKGQMRVDVNVSVKKDEGGPLGTRVEIKNINSFRAIARAIEHEYKRQVSLLAAGEEIVQETRGWDDIQGTSYSMRTKENALDYRYFPEPDLPPLVVLEKGTYSEGSSFPTLAQNSEGERLYSLVYEQHDDLIIPYEIIRKMKTEWGFHKEYINAIVGDKEVYSYFTTVVSKGFDPKLVAKRISGPILSWCNTQVKSIFALPFGQQEFTSFLNYTQSKELSENQLKIVMEEMLATGKSVQEIVTEKGFDRRESIDLPALVSEVISSNQNVVEQYKKGKKTTMGFFIGQVMKKTGGKVNPKEVEEEIRKQLGE